MVPLYPTRATIITAEDGCQETRSVGPGLSYELVTVGELGVILSPLDEFFKEYRPPRSVPSSPPGNVPRPLPGDFVQRVPTKKSTSDLCIPTT
ncbi:uncharacterized protein METZ01_LOCUS178077, partial [marine metagenome]